jgi:lysine-N-methylase
MSSKIIKTLEPKFYSDFKCVGDKCPDHCCHSWGVTINKQAYKKLRKHKDAVVKKFANDHFELLDDAVETRWAVIRMQPDGLCPALDDKGLCELQKRCGHKRLPHTCQDYPRLGKFFGNRVEMSLVLSCPSAAENILYNYSAMMFEEKEHRAEDVMHGRAGGFTAKTMPQWLPVLREFCFELTVDQNSSIDEKLFAIGMFLKQASTRLYDIDSLLGLVETHREVQAEGKSREMFAKLSTVDNLKWQVFADLDSHLRHFARRYEDKETDEGLSASTYRFQQCREQMLWLMQNDGESAERQPDDALIDFGADAKIEADASLYVDIIKRARTEYLDPYFDENPQILTNYVLYYLYHYQYLAANDKTPFEFYRIMVIDFFMLRSYLAGIAVNQKGISRDWVIKLFQSYSRRRQHNEAFVDEVETRLSERGADSAAAIFSLLK